jgi:Putative Actinobacterial Holin-X, holin superfamily III
MRRQIRSTAAAGQEPIVTTTSGSGPQSRAARDPFDPNAPAPSVPATSATSAATAATATSATTPAAVDAAADPSIGKLVSDASAHVSTLVRSEIELAKLELRSSLKNAGTGIGFFVGAAAILIFSLVFAFLTLAEGLAALGLARWLAFLIVFLVQLLLVAALAYIGWRQVKKVRAPQQTIRTTKETVGYLKSHPK